MRFLNLVMILRNILPWLNFEDRKQFDDMANVVHWSHWQSLAMNAMIICVCVTEKYTVHIPASFVYQVFMSYG